MDGGVDEHGPYLSGTSMLKKSLPLHFSPMSKPTTPMFGVAFDGTNWP